MLGRRGAVFQCWPDAGSQVGPEVPHGPTPRALAEKLGKPRIHVFLEASVLLTRLRLALAWPCSLSFLRGTHLWGLT
jgi:hypothetical protein